MRFQNDLISDLGLFTDPIHAISSPMFFRSTVASTHDLPQDSNLGDIMFTTDTQQIYVLTDTGWTLIANDIDSAEEYPIQEYVVTARICPSCGAPVDRNHRVCRYCDMPYPLELVRR